MEREKGGKEKKKGTLCNNIKINKKNAPVKGKISCLHNIMSENRRNAIISIDFF